MCVPSDELVTSPGPSASDFSDKLLVHEIWISFIEKKSGAQVKLLKEGYLNSHRCCTCSSTDYLCWVLLFTASSSLDVHGCQIGRCSLLEQ